MFTTTFQRMCLFTTTFFRSSSRCIYICQLNLVAFFFSYIWLPCYMTAHAYGSFYQYMLSILWIVHFSMSFSCSLRTTHQLQTKLRISDNTAHAAFCFYISYFIVAHWSRLVVWHCVILFDIIFFRIFKYITSRIHDDNWSYSVRAFCVCASNTVKQVCEYRRTAMHTVS